MLYFIIFFIGIGGGAWMGYYSQIFWMKYRLERDVNLYMNNYNDLIDEIMFLRLNKKEWNTKDAQIVGSLPKKN